MEKAKISTLPNLLSFLRIPLAFVFLSTLPWLRMTAILLATLSDWMDGFLARRYRMCSKVGTTLDPMADKFFVFFALTIFFGEGKLTSWEVMAMLCRDAAVIFFGLYLILMRQWDHYTFRSIWCGKIATTLQLAILMALTAGIAVPSLTYLIFLPLGVLALFELNQKE